MARVPGDWVVPLPGGLTLKEAMALGTAGFTAALSVHQLIEHGVTPEKGPVIVTGATGGVGSTAVAILAQLGYHVAASTGKTSEEAYLRKLGAQEIVHRDEVAAESKRALEKQRWAGAVDPVGGKTTAYLLKTMQYGGSIALSGLTGGSELVTTVFPFILRGVNLLGIDSVYCPMELRKTLWERLAADWKPRYLTEDIAREVTLDTLKDTLSAILRGEIRGRTVVKL